MKNVYITAILAAFLINLAYILHLNSAYNAKLVQLNPLTAQPYVIVVETITDRDWRFCQLDDNCMDIFVFSDLPKRTDDHTN